MGQTVIRVEDVSKQYRLGKIGTGTLAHDLNRWWHTIRGKQDPYAKIGEENDRTKRGNSDYVWALKNVSFEVQQGDVVGIIGRNGAGKSTLLKLLSRTTLPTNGNIKARGRIASLLEVGTGFHPELTGKENIFLNGAILGMTKLEIRRKFDEIVDFAGVEKYIDTPVKRYSSGMYVRLAFAVAAHLDPEILIVDEVLAVGDAEFQKKALGKMQDASRGSGRTVLFVSHNTAAMQYLCQKGILLVNGSITKTGGIEEVLNHYLTDKFAGINFNLDERNDRQGSGILRFKGISFTNLQGEEIPSLYSGLDCFINLEVQNTTDSYVENAIIAVGVDDSIGRRLTIFSNELTRQLINLKPKSLAKIKIKIENLPLQHDSYYFTLFIKVKGEIADWITNAGKIDVENGDYFKTGRVVEKSQGTILIKHEFFH